jgi:ABC-type polysaccharide/polyol phosphate export permease
MFKLIYSRIKNYRDLFLILAWKEFTIRYKQTIFGLLWAIIQPLSMMLLLTLIFTFFMPIKVTSHPYPVFFYSGLIFWTFFVSSLYYAIPCLKNNYLLITRIYFPKEAIPFSGIALAFIDMLISFSILFVLIFFYHTPLSLNALWCIPLIILLIIFTTSVCLILSALNVFYRDVSLVSNFLIQVWFFLTPVMYSIDQTNSYMKSFLYLNPLAFIISNLRSCLIDNTPVVLWQLIVMFIAILLFFMLSYKFFLRAERKIADVI